MKTLFGFLSVALAVWAIFEVCGHLQDGNQLVIVPANLVANFVTAGTDGAAGYLGIESNLHQGTAPWQGISIGLFLLIGIWWVFDSGVKYGENRIRPVASRSR